jgi:hypothetical protein
VASLEERIVDDCGDTAVHVDRLRTEVAVENRRQQRMRETNRSVLALDDVRGECGLERPRLEARSLQDGLRCRTQRRRERERLARRLREAMEPCAHEPFECLGNGKRHGRIDVGVEDAGELEREEGVSARPLVDSEQRLARDGVTGPVAEQPVKRADAQRLHRQAPDGLRDERVLEGRRAGVLAEPPS